MKHLITSALVILSLAGCSSATAPLRQSASPTEYSGGDTDNQSTSIYWLTERVDSPESSSDNVTFKDKSWYQSYYTWSDQQIREVTRKGERVSRSGELVPFQMTLRFSRAGEAVYQRLRQNGKVIPMRDEQINEIKQQASELVVKAKSQQEQGLELIQGHWRQGVFTTCEGKSFSDMEFKNQLPSVIIDRLVDEDNFAVFVGGYKSKKVVVNQLLILKNGSEDCIERPVLHS
ncbi:DUF1481 domain-containing protein [Vibrio rarus]|uniref:DUF1481 domain-containing protein n=1 Tax=Vibrio rarus TaxID=413403 RepID=UPI0021C2BA3D|nr:DUF1481 domain-containing protein [Vibrio rarus]